MITVALTLTLDPLPTEERCALQITLFEFVRLRDSIRCVNLLRIKQFNR